MKNLKWMTLAAVATGMLFQFGACGVWGQIGATVLGLLALQNLGA
ncbi:MAG TPA: hypothetical protein PKG54_08225 [Phycisphaerae bacterium]|jgi:hypothetical protein|nr:hypothetical protein [Phycisphaerae bacterium]HPU31431.1 hypothetical protein [Phycisphaerae bacterium]HQE41706.1 hypothetical protein [Phycisphaerae bacterium]